MFKLETVTHSQPSMPMGQCSHSGCVGCALQRCRGWYLTADIFLPCMQRVWWAQQEGRPCSQPPVEGRGSFQAPMDPPTPLPTAVGLLTRCLHLIELPRAGSDMLAEPQALGYVPCRVASPK